MTPSNTTMMNSIQSKPKRTELLETGGLGVDVGFWEGKLVGWGGGCW
jgi:hypothetical protein